jgi:hypothetical protein
MAIQPIIRLRFGADTFDVVKLMASEVAKIQAWTGVASKRAWVGAIGNDDIDAFRAGYALMKQRAGEDIRFADVDFDTDEMSADLIDPKTGRAIGPAFILDDEGDPVLDSKKNPKVEKDNKGEALWRYDDDGSLVPPTDQA